jgi:chitosanase
MLTFAYLCISAILISTPNSYALKVPSKRTVGFAGDPSINAVGIFNAAKASLKAGKDVLDAFPSSQGTGNNVKILGDWEKLNGVSVIHYIADMDVDCDGVDVRF